MPKPVCEEGDVTVLWNQAIHTDREVTTNRPDINFIVCPCNMINIFIITNTMHTIGVDKITLLKTTYYLLHVSILIGSSSGRSIPYSRSYYVGLLTGKGGLVACL